MIRFYPNGDLTTSLRARTIINEYQISGYIDQKIKLRQLNRDTRYVYDIRLLFRSRRGAKLNEPIGTFPLIRNLGKTFDRAEKLQPDFCSNEPVPQYHLTISLHSIARLHAAIEFLIHFSRCVR